MRGHASLAPRWQRSELFNASVRRTVETMALNSPSSSTVKPSSLVKGSPERCVAIPVSSLVNIRKVLIIDILYGSEWRIMQRARLQE
jgi:hypothetical protein